jgi:hypothetical protein
MLKSYGTIHKIIFDDTIYQIDYNINFSLFFANYDYSGVPTSKII